MDKQTMVNVINRVRATLDKRSPEILVGLGIAGMITTTILAVKATPKALELIEKKKIEEESDTLTLADTVKAAWICYIPSAIVGCVSVLCIVCASSVNLRRHAALATAYGLSESALKGYREKVLETVGEKQERTIRDAVAKDTLDKHPVTNNEVIITEKGNTLCYDTISGRYFRSDIEKLRKSENELNKRMRDEMHISLNDFYYEVGLDDIKVGDDIGWHIDYGYIEMQFSAQLATDGTPCLVINHASPPRYEYGINQGYR